MMVTAEAVADYLRETRKIKVGVVNLTMFRPFPGDLLGAILKGRKGVAVLERVDQPLAADLPLVREIPRDASAAAWKTARFANGHASLSRSRHLQQARRPAAVVLRLVRSGQPRSAAGRNYRRDREHAAERARRRNSSISRSISCTTSRSRPKQEIHQIQVADAYREREGTRGARQRESQPDAQGQHHGAHAFGRRLGRDHDGQESRDDAVRSARLSHQSESQVRFGEERPADHLLSVGRARTHSRSTAITSMSTSCSRPTPTFSSIPIRWRV